MKNTLCTVVKCEFFIFGYKFLFMVTLLPCTKPTGFKVVVIAPLLNSLTVLNETITENRNVSLSESFSSNVVMINLTRNATGIKVGVSN